MSPQTLLNAVATELSSPPDQDYMMDSKTESALHKHKKNSSERRERNQFLERLEESEARANLLTRRVETLEKGEVQRRELLMKFEISSQLACAADKSAQQNAHISTILQNLQDNSAPNSLLTFSNLIINIFLANKNRQVHNPPLPEFVPSSLIPGYDYIARYYPQWQSMTFDAQWLYNRPHLAENIQRLLERVDTGVKPDLEVAVVMRVQAQALLNCPEAHIYTTPSQDELDSFISMLKAKGMSDGACQRWGRKFGIQIRI